MGGVGGGVVGKTAGAVVAVGAMVGFDVGLGATVAVGLGVTVGKGTGVENTVGPESLSSPPPNTPAANKAPTNIPTTATPNRIHLYAATMAM